MNEQQTVTHHVTPYFMVYDPNVDEMVPLTQDRLDALLECEHCFAVLIEALKKANASRTIPAEVASALRTVGKRRTALGWNAQHAVWQLSEASTTTRQPVVRRRAR